MMRALAVICGLIAASLLPATVQETDSRLSPWRAPCEPATVGPDGA